MSFLATFFGARAAKAVVAGGLSLGSAIVGPEILSAVQGGIMEAIGPAVHEVGVALGGLIAGGIMFLIGHIPTYRVPNKKDA